MAKQRNRVLVILLLLIAGHTYAQQFDFEADKKQKTQFNQKIEEALNSDDKKAMRKILDKEPSLVNSSSKMIAISEHSVLSGGNIPLLYDVVDRYLNNSCSFEMVVLILKYDPFMYCSFDNLTPFYLILRYIATHEIEDCKNAENIFNLFCNQLKFDINQKYKDLPPPLSFLLSSNYAFSSEFYNKEYISSNIIKTFIDNGASVNTRDVNSTSILTYALITEKTDLFSYCINKGADVTIANNDKHDAMYYSIKGNNNDAVKTILKNGYRLAPLKIYEIGASNEINKQNIELLKLLTDESFKYVTDYNQAIQFMLIFDESKNRVLEKNSFISKTFENMIDSIPAFILIAEANNPIFDGVVTNNILYLKTKYLNSSKNLTEFYFKANIFPIVSIKSYTSDYFTSEKQSEALYNEVNNINNVISPELKNLLCSEIRQKSSNYYSKKILTGYTIGELNELLIGFPSKSEEITQRIEEIKEFTAKNDLIKNSISIVDQFYWVAKGDRSWLNSFYEISRNMIRGGDKYNIFVFAKIKNNSNEKLTVNASVNFNVITTTHLSLFSSIKQGVVNEQYYVELRPKETTEILVMYQNIDGGIEYGSGLLSAGYSTTIYEKDPFNISFRYTKDLPSYIIEKQEELKKTVVNNSGNIQVTRNGDDLFKENLDNWFGIKPGDFTNLLIYFDKKSDGEETLIIYDSNDKIIKQETYSNSNNKTYSLPSNKKYSIYVPGYGKYDVDVKYRLTHLIIKSTGESEITYDK